MIWSRTLSRPRRRVCVRADLGSLSSLDRPARREPVRLVGPGRDRSEHDGPGRRHGRDVPARARASGGDRPGGGDDRVAVRGPLLPRGRNRREPERAHRRRSLAPDVSPAGDARRGCRTDAEAVDRRARHPSRPPLHGRGRAHLHASRKPVRRLRGGRRPRGRRSWRQRSETALSAPRPTPSCSRRSRKQMVAGRATPR